MELILLSGAATFGLLFVHLFDYLVEPTLRAHRHREMRVQAVVQPNAMPAPSQDIAGQFDRAA